MTFEPAAGSESSSVASSCGSVAGSNASPSMKAATSSDVSGISWKTAEGADLVKSVFARLLSGRTVDDLPLEEHDGRKDLRGIALPDTATLRALAEAGEIAEPRTRLHWVEGVALDGLDFTGADLGDLCFFDAAIRDCVFDKASFKGLRVWRTDVADTSFASARLGGCFLGTWHEGAGNTYTRVDFTGADLRRIVCPAATFVDVDFSGAELADVDFGASGFTRCTFAGVLDSVIFWQRPPNADKPTVNPMEDVDFSAAELHLVEFRGLRLDKVTLPIDDGHVVVHNYRRVLNHGIERLSGVNALAAMLGQELHWAHPLREIGIWHHDDLGETGEERDAMARLLVELDGECGAGC